MLSSVGGMGNIPTTVPAMNQAGGRGITRGGGRAAPHAGVAHTPGNGHMPRAHIKAKSGQGSNPLSPLGFNQPPSRVRGTSLNPSSSAGGLGAEPTKVPASSMGNGKGQRHAQSPSTAHAGLTTVPGIGDIPKAHHRARQGQGTNSLSPLGLAPAVMPAAIKQLGKSYGSTPEDKGIAFIKGGSAKPAPLGATPRKPGGHGGVHNTGDAPQQGYTKPGLQNPRNAPYVTGSTPA